MGLVRFCGKQFVLAPAVLALLWLLLSGQAAPLLSAAGPWRGRGLLGFAAPAGWHSSAMDVLTMGWRIRAGLPELAAFGVALGPLVAGTLLLQLTATLTRDATPERSLGQAWVWAVAGLLVVAGGVLAAVLAG